MVVTYLVFPFSAWSNSNQSPVPDYRQAVLFPVCRTTCAVETTPKHNFSQVALPRVKVLFEGSLFFFQSCQNCLLTVKYFAFIICHQGSLGVNIS